jgi:proton-dependent oligopeptide transporter, POT family
MATTPGSSPAPVGHPRGLTTLFFTEMWERFSFYGMRAIFVPFMGLALAEGGMGFDKSESGSILALYLASVYLMSLPGGWLADKYLGQRRAVFLGGLIIILGHILLAVPGVTTFYGGLLCLVMGTGLLKPNVSTMVGKLYTKADPRRDGGFSIYYMGINIGAFASPIICGWLAQSEAFKGFLANQGISPHYSWHIAFGAAAVGMAFGLTQYYFGRAALEGIGDAPSGQTEAERARNRKVLLTMVGALVAFPLALFAVHKLGFTLTKERISNIFGVVLLSLFIGTFVGLYSLAKSDRERKAVLAMLTLAIGCVAFFALFEQAAGTMNAFAEERTETVAFGRAFPPTWFQSVNSVFIILLSPLFAWFFIWVISRKLKFNDIRKFGVSLVFQAAAFAIMLPVAGKTGVNPMYLVGFYFLSTLAELFLSPVGLSSMSKLAPPSAGGLVMGVWFLATANGDYISGRVHGLTESFSETTLFTAVIIGVLVVAVLMFVVGYYFTHKVPLESLMVEEGTGATATEVREVAPVAPSQRRQVTGYGIAAFATAAALWPVVLTDPGLGAVICVILGPSVVILGLKGAGEARKGDVGGSGFALGSIPVLAAAAVFAVVKLL